jgi:hypothetical protein
MKEYPYIQEKTKIVDLSAKQLNNVSNFLKISRNTVAVALAELKGEQKIRIRPVGKAKLNYWRGK